MKPNFFLKILFSFTLILYPVIVYFGFNYFSMGTTTGVILFIVAFRAFLLRKKQTPFDKTIFIVLLITMILCFFSLIFKSYNLVKLYPILMSVGFGSIFILSLRKGHTPIVEVLARLTDKKFSESAIPYTRKVTKVWIAFFVINTSISLYTYMFSTLENWTLYNGLLSYVFMGTVMGGEYLVRIFVKNKVRDRVLIKLSSSTDFASTFTFALSAGKEIVLLPNNQAGTLTEYKEYYDDVVEVVSSHDKENIELNLNSSITMFTSGSQGKPQKIIKNLKCLVNECEELEKTFTQFVYQTKVISTVSHQHIYGLLFRILWPCLYKREISDSNILYPEQLFKELEKEQDYTLISSPAFLKRIQEEDFVDINTKRLKAIFSSGGKLSYNTAKTVYDIFGIWPIEVYGSTETGGIAYRTQEHENQTWTFFSTVSGVCDGEGCLRITSPFIMEEDFLTNDQVEFTGTRDFILKERIDRVCKIEEKRISLVELEQKISRLGQVKDVHCTVLEEDNRFIIGCLIAQTDIWSSVSKLEKIKVIKKHLIKYFEPILLPKRFRFLDELPYNEQSKLSQKKVLGCFNGK